MECLGGCRETSRVLACGSSQPVAQAEGANLKGLAEYCGTSIQMIEQSYGRYIRKDFLGPLLEAGELSEIETKTAAARSSGTPRNRTPNRTPWVQKGQTGGRSTGYRMEAGGIEPPSESGPSRASTLPSP